MSAARNPANPIVTPPKPPLEDVAAFIGEAKTKPKPVRLTLDLDPEIWERFRDAVQAEATQAGNRKLKMTHKLRQWIGEYLGDDETTDDDGE